jgi:hypothetical protein
VRFCSVRRLPNRQESSKSQGSMVQHSNKCRVSDIGSDIVSSALLALLVTGPITQPTLSQLYRTVNTLVMAEFHSLVSCPIGHRRFGHLGGYTCNRSGGVVRVGSSKSVGARQSPARAIQGNCMDALLRVRCSFPARIDNAPSRPFFFSG